MKSIQALYVNNSGHPIMVLQEETLSDGSKVHNLNLNGTAIPCRSLQQAQESFAAIVKAMPEDVFVQVG